MISKKEFTMGGRRFLLRIPFGFWRILAGERFAFGKGLALIFTIATIGLFGFGQNSTPGDALYPLKRVVLQGEAILLSQDRATLHLKAAADSSQALKEAAELNDTQKLAIALQEYKENIKKATEALDKGPKDTSKILKITSLVNQIQNDARELENKLKTELAKEEREALAQKTLEEATNELRNLLLRELQDISSASLNEEQEKLLKEAWAAFEQEDYAKVMEDIVRIGNYD